MLSGPAEPHRALAAPGSAGPAPLPRRGLRSAGRALRHRNFAIFFTGALLSNTGTWMQNATVPFVVYQLTGSKSLIGLTAFLQFIPMVLLGPLAGSIADRFPRRLVLLCTQSAMAAIAVGLWAVWVSGSESVAALIALVTLSGVAGGLNIPAWQAFIADLVPRADLLNAVTLNSAQFNAARAVGPALAGVVLATLGPSWAFLLNALSFGFVLVALVLVRVARTARERPTRRVFGQFADSLTYVWAHPEIVLCIGVVTAVAGLGMPVFQLMPVFASDVFRVGESGYGLLTGALGFGGVLATPIIGGWGDSVRRSRLVVGSVAAYGAFLVAFALAPGLPIALVAIGLAGMAYLAVASTLNTTIQLLVQEELRGRVIAIYLMGFTAAYPVGALIQGTIADRVGARPVVTTAGAIIVLLALSLRLTSVLDRLDRPDPVPDEAADPAAPVAAG